MTSYFSHGVSLSEGQMKSLQNAIQKSMPITLRLANNQLSGNNMLNLTKSQIGRIQKAMNAGTGVDVKISRTGVRKIGGGWGRVLFRSGRKMIPKLLKKGVKTAAPGLLTGLFSNLGSRATDAALGSGIQSGGFLMPESFSKIIPYRHLLTRKQESDLANSLSSMTPLFFKPTKSQRGGILGTLLASMLIPAALAGTTELFSGSGLQNRPSYHSRPPPRRIWPKPQDGGLVIPNRKGGDIFPYRSPPFFGSWRGEGTKKKHQKGEKD